MKENKIKKLEEFELEDLVDALSTNVVKDIKNFEDLINLDGAIKREIYIGDIQYGLGSTVDGYIRFWNNYDEKHNIPIEERKPILLYIDSNGGSLTDTFTIIDAIKLSKTPIWTIVTGCAYSGGFFIAIAGHKRIGYKHSSYLYHEGSTSTGGTANQFQNYSAFYKKQLKQLEDHTLECTKISQELYDEKRRDDWWFDIDDALEYGVVDEVSEELI